MSRVLLRLDILPATQRQLWPALSVVKNSGFVLYGGTAIALRLGHRQSVDFDFFTDRSFRPAELFQKFPFLKGAQVLQEQPDTFTALVPSGGAGKEHVKLSFFGALDFGRLAEPLMSPDGVVELASPIDLLAHKLKVILQRVELKDYLDIDALLRSGIALAQGLAGAQALFKDQFPVQEPLKALTYFKGGNLDQLPDDSKKQLIQAASEVRRIAPVQVVSVRLSAR